jgi:hypothetical protein
VPYLLDTDVLVASNRIHYHPDFCQLFWDWLDTGHGKGQFFSLDKVKDELEGGKDDDLLKQWCKRPQLKSFFQSSKAHASKWQQIANWANTRDPKFTPGALAKFLDIKSADAWLIAYAAANPGWTIVTNEVSAPESRKDVKLPDAATALGVKTIPLSRLLQIHAKNNFTFGIYGVF